MNKKIWSILIVSFLIIKCAKCQDITFESSKRDSAGVKINSTVMIFITSGRYVTIKYLNGYFGTYDIKFFDVKFVKPTKPGEIIFSTADGWHQWTFLTNKKGIYQVNEIFADKKTVTEITYYK